MKTEFRRCHATDYDELDALLAAAWQDRAPRHHAGIVATKNEAPPTLSG
ncbi:MAG: hypothetical protein KDI19_15465 [Pseudomonadales bacterium]|nr:hypothetical protein [Pseudomonadales bacterium]